MADPVLKNYNPRDYLFTLLAILWLRLILAADQFAGYAKPNCHFTGQSKQRRKAWKIGKLRGNWSIIFTWSWAKDKDSFPCMPPVNEIIKKYASSGKLKYYTRQGRTQKGGDAIGGTK